SAASGPNRAAVAVESTRSVKTNVAVTDADMNLPPRPPTPGFPIRPRVWHPDPTRARSPTLPCSRTAQNTDTDEPTVNTKAEVQVLYTGSDTDRGADQATHRTDLSTFAALLLEDATLIMAAGA